MPQTSIGDPRFFARSGPHSLATVAEAALGAAREEATIGAAREVDLLLAGVAPCKRRDRMR
jgi:UDP-3-O-[3-hydroxymyristoyl] glucosamine N-acyltransferase